MWGNPYSEHPLVSRHKLMVLCQFTKYSQSTSHPESNLGLGPYLVDFGGLFGGMINVIKLSFLSSIRMANIRF